MEPIDAKPIRAVSEQGVEPTLSLAVIRTELALDRTQLAWLRTAFTFITAGLALDKGAEAMHRARVLAGTNWVKSSHAIGVALVAAATISLMISTYSYHQQARRLSQLKLGNVWLPPVMLLSLLVILLGGTLTTLLITWHDLDL